MPFCEREKVIALSRNPRQPYVSERLKKERPLVEARPGSIAARARAAAAAPYLAGLNPEQREAVETLDGPVLVLAGAGTGKTRVLTTRIAHILSLGRARPSEILAVTFTNKAALEMKQRIGEMAGAAVEGMPWLGTFHAIGVKILRRHAEMVDLNSNFTILDIDDQLRLMKQVLQADNIDEKRWPARHLAAVIDGWKNRGLLPDQVRRGEGAAFAGDRGIKLYAAYQARLKSLNAVDFGDLLLENIRLFQSNAQVLQHYQHRFRFILVDEYQDTNVAQYLWLRLLGQSTASAPSLLPAAPRQEGPAFAGDDTAGDQSGSAGEWERDRISATRQPRNICCVGDDDQCVVAGTPITLPDGDTRPVEMMEPGDLVLSSHGSGEFRAAKILRVHRKSVAGPLVAITTRGGRRLVTTPEHTHFAGYKPGLTPQAYFTYLMYKQGVGCRLGTSQVYTAGQIEPMAGFRQRALQERADAVWVIGTHENEQAARAEEYILSLTWRIPALPFVPRQGSRNGLVHDPAYLKRVFAAFDTEAEARRLLVERGLSPEHPHYRPQLRDANRRNVVLTLCGDRRGATPMHRIAIVGNDKTGRQALEALGLPVGTATAGSDSWRFETANSSYGALMEMVRRVETVFPINLVRTARLGRQWGDASGDDSLPLLPAGSIMPGMALFAADGGYDVVERVERPQGSGEVFDLDIENTHNFVAGGIVTHNSIYGWRGAEVDNILRFEKDFPGAKIIRLERNYRSTGHILAAASHLIAHNQGRLGKTLRPVGDAGEKVTVTSAWDSEEEARIIGEEIENLQRNGHSLDEMAILVRASFQTREFEDRFATLGLRLRLIGGARFYERAEIRDALAYLRCVNSERDDLAFERIVNVPRRGIGDATVRLLYEHGRAADLSLMAAARAMTATGELKPKVRQALRELVAAFDRWRSQSRNLSHNELAEIVLDESGYTEMWQRERSADAAGRLENLKELVRSMEKFENLPGFLEHIALVLEAERDPGAEAVSIMTLHAAKGLEFDTVFLPGWEEGLLPHQRSLDDDGRAALEEERRLAHVGLTRARKRAKIYFVSHRRVRGSWNATVASRFIDELPASHVEVAESPGGFGGFAGHGNVGGSRFDEIETFGSTYNTPGWQRAKGHGAKRSSADGGSGGSRGAASQRAGAAGRRTGRATAEGELVAKSTGVTAAYQVGDRVFHLKFGNGNVVQVEGNKLTIAFDKAGEKKIVDLFVERV
jgi:DNA helicase II / ATP-dependent DNA helicase PcrA